MGPRHDVPSTYDHYCGEVEAMLAVGRPLGSVERMLERAPLEAEQRSALWLLAWALHESSGDPEQFDLILAGDGPRDS